jgi:hypothetical protein
MMACQATYGDDDFETLEAVGVRVKQIAAVITRWSSLWNICNRKVQVKGPEEKYFAELDPSSTAQLSADEHTIAAQLVGLLHAAKDIRYQTWGDRTPIL